MQAMHRDMIKERGRGPLQFCNIIANIAMRKQTVSSRAIYEYISVLCVCVCVLLCMYVHVYACVCVCAQICAQSF